ncbi:MAG: phosphatase PAP2 family protein [Vicinamibacterales bacterium]
MDAALFSAVNAAHAPWADPILLGATWLGVGAAIWFALALAALGWRRHRAAAVRACLLVGVVLGVNNLVVKPLVQRPRPFQVRTIAARVIQQPPPETPSFPSGHTATAIAGAMALARVWPSARWLLGGLAALIAVSRVYVGVHYPGDLVGGAVVGVALAWLVLGGRHPSTWSRPGPPPSGSTYVP